MFGCNARFEAGVWIDRAILPVKLDGEEQYQCPRRPVLDDPHYWSDLFAFWRGFKNGLLPDDGNIMAQSARGWKLLSLLDAYMSGAEAERLQQTRGG